MFGHFYNEGMRKMTIAFGQIFNNIQIKRKDSSGAVIQSIKVPLAYAPKEKFLVRLDQQPSLSEREFAITLPRLGFEISGIEYDASRKLTKVQKFKHIKDNIDGKVLNYNYMPVPYNISYKLYCFTAKTYLYGPASTQKVIKETQSDLHTDLPTSTREERIIVTPNPTSADANDDFGFTTSITFFQDGKNYSVTTDEDV